MAEIGVRVVGTVVLLAALFGLFVLAGTVEPDPRENRYPTGADLLENPGEYVGDRVVVGGTVIETGPLTIEVEPAPGETLVFTVENTALTPEIGDQVTVYGTLQSETRIHAIESVHRAPWELYYMYLVSFLAGLWVLGRLVNGWRFDRNSVAIVPRDEPRVSWRGRGRTAGDESGGDH